MGLFGSKKQAKLDREIAQKCEEVRKRKGKNVKVLLLGTGESGKSTILKQLQLFFGYEGLTDTNSQGTVRWRYVCQFLAFCSTIEEKAGFIGIRTKVELFFKDCEDYYSLATKAKESRAEGPPLSCPYNQFTIVKELWHNETAQDVWKNNDIDGFHNNLNHFVRNISRIYDPDKGVNNDDVLQLKIRTSGVASYTFPLETLRIVVFDTGGQRAERRKWTGIFKGMDYVFHVAAVSEFDQKLFEATSDRWTDTHRVFNDILHEPELVAVPIILFMNRVDELENKINRLKETKTNLNQYFPELRLGFDYKFAVELILEYLRDELVKSAPPGKTLAVYYVSAIKKDIHSIFEELLGKLLTTFPSKIPLQEAEIVGK